MTSPRTSDLDDTLVGTAVLTLLTVAVAIGFGRIFAGGAYVLPLVAISVGTHASAWWSRRLGFSTAVAAIFTVMVASLLIVWIVLPQLTTYGWPTWHTLRGAGEALTSARTEFGRAVAPVELMPGYLIASMAGISIAAFMADWAAFRIKAPFEACVPAFTLFVFTSALGADRFRAPSVVLFVATVLAFLLTHQLARHNQAGSWFGGRARQGAVSLAKLAGAFAFVAIVLGLLVGPALPGADANPLVPYRGRIPTGPANRATVSPLVDIRGRLVERAGIEVFTVKTDTRAYWRLTSLDEFDGQIWRSEDNYRNTGGLIEADMRPDAAVVTQEVRQEYQISGLSSIWAPAAYQPVQVSGIDGVSYAPASASVITAGDTSDGLKYSVRSSIPQLDPDALRTAPAVAPRSIADRNLALPPLSARVKGFAQQLVANQPTPYDQAMAIQGFFRDNYTYDLNAAIGHDARTIERFLFNNRSGYCEQFAGTFAVLARAVGLPSRVAVGFTPGVLKDDGLYHVFDENAHAWPEVYLHGFGWVAFEPTPGRGAPGAEGYTGVPEQQDTEGASTTPTTATIPPQDNSEQLTPETSVPDPLAGQDPTLVTGDDQRPLVRRPVWLLALGMAILALLWVLIVPLLHAGHRTRRRRNAQQTGPPAIVIAAWAEAHDALRSAGVPRRGSETLREFAARAAAGAGLSAEAAAGLRRLASVAAAAMFSPSPIDVEVAAASMADGSRVAA
ncbi:MAG: transglutaminaseTgpA domain-containing protein, partial [Acidimicrobiales bacterium]